MGSHCEVVLEAADEASGRALAQVAIDEVRRIERKYSRYLTDSIVSRINAAAGQDSVACDEETNSLLDFADSLFQKSGGLFDITSGVLRQAWDFKLGTVPVPEMLDKILPLVNWGKVERTKGSLRLPQAGMEIDFGGFGKEYAADRAATALGKSGARHGYVNLAGDIGIFGPKPDGQPWVVGIQDPRQKDSIFATIPVASGALATSGDYERFFEKDGKRYCHVLDPRSGLPVTHWRSVSVLAPLAIVAGSCTTIAMLMQEQGLAFLAATGLSYLAIDHQGKIHQQTSSRTTHPQKATS